MDVLVQVDIINGKLWVQRDGTYYGVTDRFVEAGVPKERIVLAFHSQAERELGEFATA